MVIAKFLRITIPAPAYHREGFEVFAEESANLVFYWTAGAVGEQYCARIGRAPRSGRIVSPAPAV